MRHHQHEHIHRHGRGDFEGFGPRGPFGPGGPFGPRGGFGGGRGGGPGGRRRRGDVRLGLLLLLKLDGPANGYRLIQALEERSEGLWRPSPGSVYPTLSQLEDEGLIQSAAQEGESGKVFELTAQGLEYLDGLDNPRPPWEPEQPTDPDDPRIVLWKSFGGLARAIKSITQESDAETVTKAVALLAETRKGLYRLLAEEDD